jgi:cbb3-type cytochrome oxidase subunit 3
MAWSDLAHLARSMWILWMFGLFLAAGGYALWPRNRAWFEDCALIPFRTDSEDHAHE